MTNLSPSRFLLLLRETFVLLFQLNTSEFLVILVMYLIFSNSQRFGEIRY